MFFSYLARPIQKQLQIENVPAIQRERVKAFIFELVWGKCVAIDWEIYLVSLSFCGLGLH